MGISTLTRKLKTFAGKSWDERGLFFETYLRLGLARASVLTLPFSRLARPWGVPYFEELRYPHNDDKRAYLKQLRWAIRAASKYTPWDSNCLAKAIAAKKMLRKRGYTSTLYLGMTTPGTSQKNGEVEAHAWLRCGDTWICGLRASRGFTVVATFTESKNATKSNTFADVGEVITKLKKVQQ